MSTDERRTDVPLLYEALSIASIVHPINIGSTTLTNAAFVEALTAVQKGVTMQCCSEIETDRFKVRGIIISKEC